MSAPATTVAEEKMALLREALEVVMWELTALNARRWNDLKELRAKKEDLAERLREFEWIPGPEDTKNMEVVVLTLQVNDLEYQCRQKIKTEMQRNRTLFSTIQQKHFDWLACLQTYRNNAYQD